ncbi:DUF5676 family membrane protein [Aminobacter anthyllidis]|uniref:DUF5676 family membrane protein n=1 Tax=Aminobacter anthyllidis TaxID=1035067 RepID=UPI002456C004|nr:DUF5676 family membrane protein [Aminobacter anthyllidis]MDH4985087.1 DUF5676 family membrane protein [Aminobacter anthyllidis]
MNRLSTLSVGVALGATLALLSMLCALTFALWPDATLDFFGAFSHGLDFGTIKSPAPISPGRALYGIVGLGIVGLVAGVVYASIYNVAATGRR